MKLRYMTTDEIVRLSKITEGNEDVMQAFEQSSYNNGYNTGVLIAGLSVLTGYGLCVLYDRFIEKRS